MKILLTLWQLPQTIVAWIILVFLPAELKTSYKGRTLIYSEKMHGGISLGNYIILGSGYLREGIGNTVKHEYGHTRQSRMLGWLYLIVIGLPSLLWAAFYQGDMKGYYTKFYTEIWADRLGGVVR